MEDFGSSSGNPTIAEFIDLLGEGKAKHLFQLFGGTTIYVPTLKNLHSQHPLVEAVGFEVAEKLATEYSLGSTGVRLRIPMGTYVARDIERAQIMTLLSEGWSVAAIALKANLHERSVYRHRARYKQQINKIHGKAITKMLAEDFAPASIAERLGIPAWTIQGYERKHQQVSRRRLLDLVGDRAGAAEHATAILTRSRNGESASSIATALDIPLSTVRDCLDRAGSR